MGQVYSIIRAPHRFVLAAGMLERFIYFPKDEDILNTDTNITNRIQEHNLKTHLMGS